MAFDPAESAASLLRRWAHAMLAHRHGSEVYQISTMGALLDGVYDGDVTIRELLRHGDFGLGTFNGLDGEMLVLDGVCYQLRSDGSAQVAEPTTSRGLIRRADGPAAASAAASATEGTPVSANTRSERVSARTRLIRGPLSLRARY